MVAAVYNYENHTVEFQMILDEKQRERAKGSKYMQSKPGDIYQEAYRWLMDNPIRRAMYTNFDFCYASVSWFAFAKRSSVQCCSYFGGTSCFYIWH